MNFFISVAGWFLWNLAELYIEKSEKENDNDPSTNWEIKLYAKTHWPLWIGSLVCVPVILWMGYRNLDINPLGSIIGLEANAWHDLYILAAGAAFEAFIFGVKYVKKFFKKKESEL